jgi:nicotinate phosphoribosyltransferase
MSGSSNKLTVRGPRNFEVNLLTVWTELSNVTLTAEEETFLNTTCLYLQHGSYMSFLKSFRFQPQDHVKITFQPDSTTSSSPTDKGTIAISVTGLWADTILYEIPLLALTSEAYFRFVERDWSHDNQESRAFDKGRRLIHAGCTFSEFGTRRRRDYHAQELVMAGLSRAHRERPEGSKGGLAGTSNVHFAMKFGTNPIGTVAHEWFMGIAAVGNNYMQATRDALKYWVECFGEGVLAVALTDTFGTRAFLEVFGEEVPESVLVAAVERRIAVEGEVKGLAAGEVQTERNSKKKTWAEAFTGVRQDSGDPKNFVKLMRDFYDSRAGGKTTGTTIVFSDSLNVDRCIDYKKCAEENGFKPSFGIGTFLTSECLCRLCCMCC